MRQVRGIFNLPAGADAPSVDELLTALEQLARSRGITITGIIRGGISTELSKLTITAADIDFLVDAGVETADQLREALERVPGSAGSIFTGSTGWALHRRLLRKLLVHGARRPFSTRTHLAEYGSTVPLAIYQAVLSAGKGALSELCALDVVDLLQAGLTREQAAELQRRLYAWRHVSITPLRPNRRLGDLLEADMLALLAGTEFGPETLVTEAMAAWWRDTSRLDQIGQGFDPLINFRWPVQALGVGYQDGVAVVLPLRKGR